MKNYTYHTLCSSREATGQLPSVHRLNLSPEDVFYLKILHQLSCTVNVLSSYFCVVLCSTMILEEHCFISLCTAPAIYGWNDYKTFLPWLELNNNGLFNLKTLHLIHPANCLLRFKINNDTIFCTSKFVISSDFWDFYCVHGLYKKVFSDLPRHSVRNISLFPTFSANHEQQTSQTMPVRLRLAGVEQFILKTLQQLDLRSLCNSTIYNLIPLTEWRLMLWH